MYFFRRGKPFTEYVLFSNTGTSVSEITTLAHPLTDYDEVEFDPMLGVDGLREMGETWAAGLDSKDYKVSPLFGEVGDLPKTTLFVGTHEIFYPDVVKFYNKLIDNGVDAELNVGEGMTHVYAIYPLVPESKEAFKHIVKTILD